MSDLLKRLRVLCVNCILAPQNRNVGDEGLRPCCTVCSLKWEAAAEIERLSAELDVISQNYVHACESIANKDKMIADRDEIIGSFFHKRKCWNCGNVHLHCSDVVPGVLCPECGSQDTRRVKP